MPAIYLLIILLSILLLIKGVIPAWQNAHSDFSNYFASAKLVQTHSNLDSLYNDKWFYKQAMKLGVPEAIKFSPFPQVTAFVMLPLTFFNVEIANRIWIMVNLLLFFPAVVIIRKMTSWSWQLSALFILASGLSLINNIKFGQIYWMMTVAVLYSFYWIDGNKNKLAGITLGVFTSIKYFSIVFIAGQFFAKQYKAVAFALLTIFLLFCFQLYFFGQQVMSDYLSLALMPHLSGHLSSQNSLAFEFQSWESFLLNLLGDSNAKDIAKWIIYFIFISPLFFIFIRYKKLKTTGRDRSIYFSMPALAAMVLLPASASYHFILLLIPVVILLSDSLLTKATSRIVVFLYLCIGFIPYHFFLERGSKSLILAYPRLGLITMLYGVALYSVFIYLSREERSN